MDDVRLKRRASSAAESIDQLAGRTVFRARAIADGAGKSACGVQMKLHHLSHRATPRPPFACAVIVFGRILVSGRTKFSMATGRGNYLTKEAGEYIVAAELSRRGFVATTFTGNVPSYDIVAVDHRGGHALVQLKAIAAASWQFTVTQFADVVFDGSKQIVRGPLPAPYPDLICVMVQIAPADSPQRDRFYILPWQKPARIVADGHKEFLAKHGGVRPKQPMSLHTAVKLAALPEWENRWDVLKKRVQPAIKPLQLASNAEIGVD